MEKDLKLRTIFDQVAKLYDKIRPHYPEALFDELINQTRLNEDSKLLEIGPGTGQATLPLAKHDYNIVAIELGSNLAEIARQNLKNYPNIKVITGAFEDIELPPESFDLVYIATALHWIKPEIRFAKPHKLLKPAGYLSIISGSQILDKKGDHFLHTTQPLYDKYMPSDPDSQPFHLQRLNEVKPADLDSSLFELIYFKCFPRTISYTANEYCQLLNTDSGKLALPPNKRTEFLKVIKQLINEKFGGSVNRHYANSLTIAKKIS